jgi:hypothetical protein
MRRRLAWALAGLALTTGSVRATSIKSVGLAALFQEADVVVLVRVDSADARAFDDAVYRGTVVEAFKGASKDSTIYFGPYVRYRLGGDYVAFLQGTQRNLGSTLRHEPNPWPDSSDEPLLRIMYAGYSMLPVEFTCVFPDCADGVSVPSSQVILPAGVPVVRHESMPGSNYDSWVRKDAFLGLLRSQGRNESK